MTDHFFNSKRNLNDNISSSRRAFLKQSVVTGMAITSGLSITVQTLAKSPFSQLGLSQNKITPNPIGFNGERQDPITKQYHLGNGVRMYNPSLMRFHAKDSMSPFGKGGINSYAYCLGDPVNRRDPSGHFAILSLLIGMIVGAIIGASIAAAAEGVKASVTGTAFDWKQVAIGAALGAIGGGFGAAAQGASFGIKVGLAIGEAFVSGIADFSLNAAAGEPIKNAVQNAAIGAVIGLVTFSIGAGLGKSRLLNRFLGRSKKSKDFDLGGIDMGKFRLFQSKKPSSTLLVSAHGESNGYYYDSSYTTSYFVPHGSNHRDLGLVPLAARRFKPYESFPSGSELHDYTLQNFENDNALAQTAAWYLGIDILIVNSGKQSNTYQLDKALKKHGFDYSMIEMAFCRSADDGAPSARPIFR